MASKASVTFKNFYWWISNDDYLTTGKQILYSENIALSRYSDAVELSHETTDRYTTTDRVLWFFDARETVSSWNYKYFAYTEDGKIYDTSDGSVEYTLTANTIQNHFKLNWYIYFVVEWSLWPLCKITEENAYDNLWSGNVTTNVASWDITISNWDDITPTIVFLDNIAYLWVWNTVYSIDNSEVVTAYDIFDWLIVWLTRVGWVIKVFTEKWTIAFWDWDSTEVDSVLEIKDDIRLVRSLGKNDIMICWRNQNHTTIKVLSWYDITTIYQSRYSTKLDNHIWEIDIDYNNQMDVFNNNMYTNMIYDGNARLLSYWTENPIFPAWMHIALQWDSTWTEISDWITAIKWFNFPLKKWVYLWIEIGSTYSFEFLPLTSSSTENHKESWFMILNPFDWWSKTIHKKIEKITIATSNCDASETVELQYSIDGWAFSSIQTINSWTDITRTEIFDHNDSFYDIQFKILMTSSWSAWDTPRFYELKLDYIEIERK